MTRLPKVIQLFSEAKHLHMSVDYYCIYIYNKSEENNINENEAILMRKKILVAFLMILVSTVVSCTQMTTMPTTMNPATTQTVDYQAIITATIAKLEEIIAEHGDATEEVLAQPIAAQPTKRVSQEDDGIITSEEYHDVYDTQRDNSTDVTLCEQFEIYVFFIREISAKIEQDSEISLGVAFDIVSDSFGQLRLT